MVHLSEAFSPRKISLEEILRQTDSDRFREFLLEELPIRYAQRVQLLQMMPEWNMVPRMRLVRALYRDAFCRLRMTNATDADQFRMSLQNIKNRNSGMLTHIVK